MLCRVESVVDARCVVWRPEAAGLVSEDDGDEALLEGGCYSGGGDQHEATDLLSAGEDGEVDAFGWQFESGAVTTVGEADCPL